MSSGDKPTWTWKISLTNFCRFQYFGDFDIKTVLFGQNSGCKIFTFAIAYLSF